MFADDYEPHQHAFIVLLTNPHSSHSSNFRQTTFSRTTYVITASPETASAEMTYALITYAQTAPADEAGTVQDVAIP
jgi:hypothetical protein